VSTITVFGEGGRCQGGGKCQITGDVSTYVCAVLRGSLVEGAQRGPAPDSNLIGIHLLPTAMKRDTRRGSRAIFPNSRHLVQFSG